MAKSATKPPPPQATVTAKPPQQAGKPAAKGGVKGSAPPVAKGSVKGSAPPVAKGSFKGSAPPVVTQKPPTHARKHQKMSRDSPKVWADDDDIDLEDLTFALPIVISLILLFVFFFRQYVRRTVQCPSSNRLEGKTVVITGGNTGIGKATATELARRGARVIMGCRNHQRGEAVARMIKQKTKNQDVFSYQLDLASLESVKSFVDDFNNKESALHVLINNAAYMGPRAATVEHYERTFGVNYLGHFMLTNLLIDRLKRGAPSRIINVVSDSYKKAKLDFDDLSMANKYDIYQAYARSKLAQVIFNIECHRRFYRDVVCSYGVHPGMVCTDLMRNWPGFQGNMLRTIARILFKPPEDGCQTVVFCAVADKLREQSGKIFSNCQLYKVKESVKDHDLGAKLWETSLHLCGLDEEAKYEKEAAESAAKKRGAPGVQDLGSTEGKKDK